MEDESGTYNETIEEDTIDEEPQITSLDPNERKLARSLRIQKRIGVSQCVQPDEVTQLDVEKSLTDKQIENSWEFLRQLILEGEELVTNVRVANVSREVKRREQEDADRQKLLEKLDEEALAAFYMFDAISAKWKSMTESNDPLDIHYDLIAQKTKCNELLKQKDNIIAVLRDEVVNQDLQFAKDQRKQTEDVAVLCERIDKQVNLMRKAYRNELKLIEESIMTERIKLFEANNKKWEKLYKQRHEEEEENMEAKMQQMLEYEEELQNIIKEYQEKYRATKIQLETDIQTLTLELEQVKALCVLNSEKLDYNYIILKRREEENSVIKARQKRKLNKLQDIINELKQKIQECEQRSNQEITRLTDEIVKLNKSVIDIETKADHFSEVNDRKYNQVWDMNFEEASQKLQKILDIDKILHEQQLGIDWVPSEKKILHKNDLSSYKTAHQILSNINSKDKSIERFILCDNEEARTDFLRRLLFQIAEKSDFLVESKLNAILKPYFENDKTLVRLDNAFCALGIMKTHLGNALIEYFLPYSYCPVCKIDQLEEVPSEKEMSIHFFSEDDEELTVDKPEENPIVSRMLQSTIVLSDIIPLVREHEASIVPISTKMIEPPEKVSEHDETSDVESVSPQINRVHCPNNHLLAIKSAYILRGLKDFTYHIMKENHVEIQTMSSRINQKHDTVSRFITMEDVEECWNSFTEVFSTEYAQLWDCIMLGLQRYHLILKARHKLNIEVKKLRKQNEELKRLLGNNSSSEKLNFPPLNFNRRAPGKILSKQTLSSAGLVNKGF